jgi:hypothetical protein
VHYELYITSLSFGLDAHDGLDTPVTGRLHMPFGDTHDANIIIKA